MERNGRKMEIREQGESLEQIPAGIKHRNERVRVQASSTESSLASSELFFDLSWAHSPRSPLVPWLVCFILAPFCLLVYPSSRITVIRKDTRANEASLSSGAGETLQYSKTLFVFLLSFVILLASCSDASVFFFSRRGWRGKLCRE